MPKISAIQMCSSMNLDENLQTAASLIKEAAEHGAELAVLPEMFAIIGWKATDKVELKEKYGDGKIQNFLSEQARKNKIWLVGGTIPISSTNPDKIRAACIVYDDKGKAVARYDKMHLFDATISPTEKYMESNTTEAGEEITVIDTPLGKLGLAVCFDIRFPHLFTQLVNQGAEIIAIPSAFTVKTGQAHWELLARSRAVDSFCYIIGACQGGLHSNNRETYGSTLIVDPWGSVLQKMNNTDKGVIYADINLERLYKIRSSIPIKKS